MDTQLIDGRYRLVRSLSSCPGNIHDAHDEQARRSVIVEVLESSWLPSQVLEERRVGALIDHPGFVRTLDAGVDPKTTRAFVVMEAFDGRPVSELVKEGPAQLDEALAIVRAVLSALGAAHGKNVVLPELRPEDVLVRLDDGGVRVKIHARFTKKLEHLPPRTRLWVAPEQLSGGRYVPTVESNLYEVGVLLHEMLTGEPPYGAGDALSLAKEIREGRPLPIRAELGVPRGVQQAIWKALERKPEDRFRSAAEFVKALD